MVLFGHKGIVTLAKNKNSVIIYSPSVCSKTCMNFFLLLNTIRYFDWPPWAHWLP